MTVEERKSRVKEMSGDFEFFYILQYVTAFKVRDIVIYTSVIFFLAKGPDCRSVNGTRGNRQLENTLH